MIGNVTLRRVGSDIVPTLIVVATAGMLVFRIATADRSPGGWLRVAFGALSFLVLLALRRTDFARAAIYAFAIECIGGVGVFAFIDAPFIMEHVPPLVRAIAGQP